MAAVAMCSAMMAVEDFDKQVITLGVHFQRNFFHLWTEVVQSQQRSVAPVVSNGEHLRHIRAQDAE